MVRAYYLFQLIASEDQSYRVAIHNLWTSGEIAAGVIISCLPFLPRLIRTCAPRIHSALSSEVKMGERTPTPGAREKRRTDEQRDWHELQTEASDQYPSLNECGPKQGECGSKDDSSQASLFPAPPTVSHGEHLPGQILMTTYIETRTEESHIADRALHADLERQRW